MKIDGSLTGMMLPSDDIEESIAFYRDLLGLSVRFHDGAEFASLNGGEIDVSLGAGNQLPPSGRPELMFRVKDLDATADALRFRPDAKILEGKHERFVRVIDPSRNVVILYEPRTTS